MTPRSAPDETAATSDGVGDMRTSRMLARALWAGLAATVILGIAAMAWFAAQSRSQMIEANAASLRNVVLTVERYLSSRIENIDALLQTALAGDMKRLGGGRGRRLVELAAAANPSVRRLAILELQSGRAIYFWSRDPALTEASLVLGDTLAGFRRDPDLVRRVGEPTRLGPNGERSAILARRSDATGEALVAVAEFGLTAIQTLVDMIEVPGEGSLSIYRSDGLAILRAASGSEPEAFNVSATLREFDRRQPSAVISSRDGEGAEFLVARGILTDLPLAVVATASVDNLVAPWRRDLIRQMAPYPFGLALLACIVVLLTKRTRKREELEREARRKSALLEATLENMDQGLMMFDAETRVQVCNARAIELLALPPELMASQPRFDDVTKLQFATGEFVRTEQHVQDWIANRGFERTFHSYERERPDGTVLEIRTVPIQDGGAVRTYTDITERKQVEKRIAHIARHDALTGLANRLLFRERLEEELGAASRDGGTLAVICLDLDHFKTVNDTLGHSFGDALLAEVASRIRQQLGEGDLVARLGGDEFAVLMSGAPQPESALVLSERLVQELSLPFSIEGQQIHVGVSIGLSLAPEDGLDPSQLLKNADLALYRAKSEGRGRYRRFEAEMAKEVEDRRALELDMRDALARGEFRIVFQPFLDLASGTITGFEALVRWQHPVRGTISPADFIPVAEETGLIVPLGEWVLREACLAALSWPEHVSVAVNVSAVQFRNANVHATVASTLLATGLSPRRLEVEVTESVLMSNKEACLRALHLLRGFGVRIAMDDFGTGYSSLSYLRLYPFDKLKIDRSFVLELGTSPDAAAIIRTIASLAGTLGMTTTVEGVETEVQLDQVSAAGCTAVQGYLVSRLIPLAEATRLVAAQAEALAA